MFESDGKNNYNVKNTFQLFHSTAWGQYNLVIYLLYIYIYNYYLFICFKKLIVLFINT